MFKTNIYLKDDTYIIRINYFEKGDICVEKFISNAIPKTKQMHKFELIIDTSLYMHTFQNYNTTTTTTKIQNYRILYNVGVKIAVY